jgi:hypothetical protein
MPVLTVIFIPCNPRHNQGRHSLHLRVPPSVRGMSHAEQLHSPRWAGSMIDANFLRDIDWACGILSSDIAVDAMPAGKSWRSSATSCQ